jgi:hypothetical protein
MIFSFRKERWLAAAVSGATPSIGAAAPSLSAHKLRVLERELINTPARMESPFRPES